MLQIARHFQGFFNRPFVEAFHGRFRDECLNRE
jgi:hypothetical protein